MKICPKCDVSHEKPGTYCSRSCANSHIRTEESKRKTAKSMKKVIRRPRTQKQIEKWRKSILVTKANKRQERTETAKLLPFDELSGREKRSRILREQDGKCAHCGIIQEWNGKVLGFELDHIDGDRTNDARSNLEFLCPNCHSQTHTYRGKNRNSTRIDVTDSEFLKIIIKEKSIYAASKFLNMKPGNATYKRGRRLLKNSGLDLFR